MGKVRIIPNPAMCSLFATLLISCSILSASEESEEYFDSKIPTSYCGLYCVYSAAQSLGVDLRIENLVKQKYLTGRSGSSSDNLVSLAKDNGLAAIWRSGLTIEDLEFATHPMILHVRPPGTIRYSHWILFLGFDADGTAKVFDPPQGGKLTKANLMAIWDGSALIVGRSSERLFSWPYCVRIVFIVCCAIGSMLVLHKRFRGGKLIGVVAASIAFAVCILPEGFLWNPKAVRNVASAHFGLTLRAITHDQLDELLEKDMVVLIDARPYEAFKDFCLPHAINIPIGSGEVTLMKHLDELKRSVGSKRVVTYCQSIKCGWADKVGSLIQQRTGIPVEVYKEGVNGWRSRNTK